MNLLQIPSPDSVGFSIGPFEIRWYAVCILIGIFVAARLCRRRFAARGGKPEDFDSLVLVMVLSGVLGARAYHVITDSQLYFAPGRNPWQALNIRNGGLGIWGGVIAGGLATWIMCRRRGLAFGEMADVIAPGLLFAQGIGRLGNWFNQELFGRPTDLPWGLAIDPGYRPTGYESYATYHPAFLYELVWNLTGGLVLLWVEKRFRCGRGKLFLAYIVWYTFGRFFIEALRIDAVNHIGAFRVNSWVSAVIFLSGLTSLVFAWRRKPGMRLWPFGFPGASGISPARPLPGSEISVRHR